MTQSESNRRPAFALARRLADPRFRRLLDANGFHGGRIITASDDEPVREVLARVFDQTTPPTVVAIERTGAEFGFVFMQLDAEQARPAERDDEPGATTSIGMVYDTIAARGRRFRVPNSWRSDQTVLAHRFETVPA